MVNIYCTLIINNRRTFENVPDAFKEQVKARLRELGYDQDGEKLEA